MSITESQFNELESAFLQMDFTSEMRGSHKLVFRHARSLFSPEMMLDLDSLTLFTTEDDTFLYPMIIERLLDCTITEIRHIPTITCKPNAIMQYLAGMCGCCFDTSQ